MARTCYEVNHSSSVEELIARVCACTFVCVCVCVHLHTQLYAVLSPAQLCGPPPPPRYVNGPITHTPFPSLCVHKSFLDLHSFVTLGL